jgi:hypothetical protein
LIDSKKRKQTDEPQHTACTSSSFSIEKIVGVWRDYATGERLVAVVWADDNPAEGGTWEDFSTLQMEDFAPQREPGVDSDDEGVTAQKESNDQDSQAGSNWHEWFGTQLTKGKPLIVQWIAEQDSTLLCETFPAALAGG